MCVIHRACFWISQNQTDLKTKQSAGWEGMNHTLSQICSSSHIDGLQSHPPDYACISHFRQPCLSDPQCDRKEGQSDPVSIQQHSLIWRMFVLIAVNYDMGLLINMCD